MVDGAIVYEHGEFTRMDAPQVLAQAQEQLHRLLQRVD
jgi:hypothetical protein